MYGLNGRVYSREFKDKIAEVQDAAAYARLGRDLRDWLLEWQPAGLMVVSGVEAILRLLVLRQLGLMPEPELLPLLACDEKTDGALQAERVWQGLAGTGQGLEAEIGKQAGLLRGKNEVLHWLLAPGAFFGWSSIPELALRRLVERLAQVDHSLLWMSLIESEILKVVFSEQWERSSPLARRASSSFSLAESFIPQGIVNVLGALTPVMANQSVYDPLCGLGQVFREVVNQNCAQPGSCVPDDVRWFTQDVQDDWRSMARLSFLLLRIQPLVWLESSHFGKRWRQELARQAEEFDWVVSFFSPHAQFEGESDGEAFLLDHILSLLAVEGRAVLAMAASVLFRRSAYSVRKRLVESAVIERVIYLPEAAFRLGNHNTVPMVVVILRRRRSFLPSPPEPEAVAYRLIDARSLPLDGERVFPTQSLFRAVYTEAVLDARLSFCDVTVAQCRGEDYNLNPPLYLPMPGRSFELERGLAHFEAAELERSAALREMGDCLARLGLNKKSPHPG